MCYLNLHRVTTSAESKICDQIIIPYSIFTDVSSTGNHILLLNCVVWLRILVKYFFSRLSRYRQKMEIPKTAKFLIYFTSIVILMFFTGHLDRNIVQVRIFTISVSNVQNSGDSNWKISDFLNWFKLNKHDSIDPTK